MPGSHNSCWMVISRPSWNVANSLVNAETSEIEDANPFLISIIGYSHEELIGKTLWDIGAFRDTTLNKDAFDELKTKRYICGLDRNPGQRRA
ncbi:hypothetical protein [uncultured Thiodictyon sp.]|uniref:hypothetical protein n=1 Tax=uncultured Thiodictyon sp. TaxID=1846217 RepID=UPI0025E4D85C|nr:hypothetical protein [uncultured Thiodictyon sp.]